MAKKKKKPKQTGGQKGPQEFDLPPFMPRMMEGIMRELLAGEAGRPETGMDRAQDLVDQAYQTDRPDKRAKLARRALEISPDCADAYLVLAEQAETLEEALRLYGQAVAAGERAIGKQEFQQYLGNFWGILETRPYMRARLELARLLWETGDREKAVEHYREMLRLNPNDNQGIRYLLLSALMDLDRDDEAEQLVAQYDDDASAEWAYTRALLVFRKEGDSERARNLLSEAVEANQHVPEYLVGNRPLPTEPPAMIGMGDQDEAVSYVGQFLRAWRNTSGAIPWVRKSLKVPMPRAPRPRKPAWSQFREKFLHLPRAEGEAWQVDLCQLPLSTDELGSKRLPWAILIVNGTEEQILHFEISETKPPTAELWDELVETLLRPRAGEPHRPEQIEVRRRTFWNAWRKKLGEIGVECVLREELETLDELLETLTPPPGVLRRMIRQAEGGPAPETFDLTSVPQEFGETWQADVRQLPSWVEHEGEMQRPWAVLVTNRDEQLILAQGIGAESPTSDWLWEHIAQAVCEPVVGEPHRPSVIQVRSQHYDAVRERLEAAGIECEVAHELDQIDEIFQQLATHFAGGKALPAMVEVPGVRLEQAGGFYRAAAEFYQQAPWRRIPGDLPLKIECEKFQNKTWYGVIMGQSGMVLGLAMYEDFDTLRTILSGEASDEENFRRTTGLSVMYGEAFEIPIPDLEAIEKHHWPVAGPEAYPNPIRVNPGRSVRPPLAWELELLEGCLRAIPQFLAEKTAGRELVVPVASGELKMRLTRMEGVA